VDEHLRDLEAALARGDAGVRARLLRERLRVDRLDPGRVAVAAHLGDADAAFVLGRAAAPTTDVGRSIEGLAAWGQEPFRRQGKPDDLTRALDAPTWGETLLPRAALALARAVPGADEARIVAARDAAAAWLADPSRAAARGAGAAAREVSFLEPMSVPGALAFIAAAHVTDAWGFTIPTIKALRVVSGATLRRAVEAYERPGGPAGLAAEGVARALGPDATREAVRRALVPWLLDA
jgi:hypothetical protein